MINFAPSLDANLFDKTLENYPQSEWCLTNVIVQCNIR